MRQHNVLFFLFLIILVVVFSGCKKRCTEERECFCSDGTSSVQDCFTDGSSCGPCDCVNEYSIWCDDETDLCWQDPQKDAYEKDEDGEYIDIGVTSKEAIQYCEELTLGGHSSWRLPKVNELRGLVNIERYRPGSDFPGIPYHEGLWSSSSHYTQAWYIDFYYGHVYTGTKTRVHGVRCVSGGP